MKSIRSHLSRTMLLGFGALLLLSSLSIYFFTRVALLKEFDAGLKTRAQIIMSASEQGEDGFQLETGDTYFSDFNAPSASQFFEIWQTDGKVCARSKSLKNADLPQHHGSLSKPAYWNLVLPDGSAGRAIGLEFLPKVENEEGETAKASKVILVVASNRETLERTLAILATMLVAAGLLTILITIPMVGLSLRRGHAPLELLARQAATINADSLQSRFPVESMPEELQPIARRLNDLLGRLETSFERERRFSADLAHELRTPLAELRSHAEVEMQWADGAESEKHRETLDIAIQMESMVTRLLELARSENKEIPLHVESVVVAPLIEDVWRPLAPKAQKKQLAVKTYVPPDASLQTDPVLLRSILANLLSNAVEYTPERGMISIDWLNDVDELRISNTVHDLNADDVPHLFERLWRKDKSRTGTDHCGLGLSLSSEFAKLLGLSLTARFAGENTLILSLKTHEPGAQRSSNRPQ